MVSGLNNIDKEAVRKMILYIDVCVRGDSRTRELGEALLSRLGGDVVRVNIGEMKFDITDEALKRRKGVCSLLVKRDGSHKD